MRPSGAGRKADVGERFGRMAFEVRGHAAGELAQRLRALADSGRTWQSRRSSGGAVAVVAAGASSTTTCAFVPLKPNELTPATARRGSAAGHGVRLVGTTSGRSRHVDVRIRTLQVQVRRNLVVLQRQHDLDQAGDAGRGFEMPDVRLHRSDGQRPIGRRAARSTAPSARTSIGSPSDVPVPCASTYDTSAGLTPPSGERVTDHRLLRRAVRHGQPAAAAVLVHGAAANHREDAIAVRDARRTVASAPTTPQPSPRT